MHQFNLDAVTYCVSGLEGFTLSEALRYWKAKFETIKHFMRDVITHECLEDLGGFVKESWDQIKPITVGEALQERNSERRRVMFDCIGVAKLFKQLNPELLDKKVVSKKRTRWDENNRAYEHRFEDVYELYRIVGTELFEHEDRWRKPNDVYAVRCWCTTTNREYWIYVPEEIALGKTARSPGEENPDAIRSIAWTIRVDVSNPKRIFRQGDIIVVEESEDSQTVEPYHLTAEQYLKLLFSET